MRIYLSERDNGESKGLLTPLYGFGTGLIGMGILVLFFPMILAIMVAIAFVSIGITLLGFAWKLSNSAKHSEYHELRQ